VWNATISCAVEKRKGVSLFFLRLDIQKKKINVCNRSIDSRKMAKNKTNVKKACVIYERAPPMGKTTPNKKTNCSL